MGLAVLFSNPHFLERLWSSRSHPIISMIYAPRFQRPFEKWRLGVKGMSVSKGPGIHCGGRYPYGTPAVRNIQHIGGAPWKSNGTIRQMFCRKAASRWNFAELKLRGMPDQRSAWLNRKQRS